MTQKKVRIAVLGTGFMAGAHASCYLQDERTEIRCICGSSIPRAEEFQKEYGAYRIEADWVKAVQAPDIDLVDITLPNHLHYKAALETINRGKSFILEKPLALTVDQAEEIVRLARRKGVRGFYAENRLFAPLFVRARDMIAGGEIGNTKLFRINELGSGPGHAGWFRDKERSGGGALIDIGIHGICLSEWLLDSPIISVTADAVMNGSVEETVITNCRFANGTLGQFVCSWGIQGGLDIRAEVFGEQGTLLLDQSRSVNGISAYKTEKAAATGDLNRPHLASDVGWSVPYVDEWNIKGHRYELRHFIDCLTEDGTECRAPLERGLRTLKVVQAIYDSIKEGKQINISPYETDPGEKNESL